MNQSRKISPEDNEKIDSLASEVNELIKKNYRDAYAVVIEALELVPEPKSAYEEATWLFAR